MQRRVVWHLHKDDACKSRSVYRRTEVGDRRRLGEGTFALFVLVGGSCASWGGTLGCSACFGRRG
eukprot:7665576-Pyramimonas_sp.AAC.1